MSEEQTSSQPSDVQLDFDDLDNFSKSFFGQKEEEQTKAPEKVEDAVAAEDDATHDDPEVESQDADTTSENNEDDTSEDDSDEPAEENKGKKPSRFQERINELTNARREAERREQALIARLEALEKPQAKEPVQTPKVSDSSPTPTDLNEDGTEKYPLGEFDPSFIRDLTKFSVAEATAEAKRQAQEEAEKASQQTQAKELAAQWDQRQDTARSRYSDYAEKVASLEPVFAGIDPQLGDYLAQTVMAMDKGPEVLYYLSEHPDEARDIMKLGAVKATIKLGRLEANFQDEAEETPPPKPRVSKAPPPPKEVNRGSAGGTRSVPDDTDDLDAFAAKFFKRKPGF